MVHIMGYTRSDGVDVTYIQHSDHTYTCLRHDLRCALLCPGCDAELQAWERAQIRSQHPYRNAGAMIAASHDATDRMRRLARD